MVWLFLCLVLLSEPHFYAKNKKGTHIDDLNSLDAAFKTFSSDCTIYCVFSLSNPELPMIFLIRSCLSL